ncbi:MAG: type I 3-dehydroquinate dehydratase [Candidatus Methylarchaceae archaeon HK01B]|nr:type I 3-dehydroquinate dehydratase [Candidatus Methylarchaceae archaeon HK01B]
MNTSWKSRADFEMLNRRAKICASIGVRDIKLLKKRVEEALDLGSDLIEVRIDYLDEMDFSYINEVVKLCEDRCILTCRARGEGGEFRGSEEERQKLILDLTQFRPTYIDIELSLARSEPEILDIIKRARVSTIISWHDFKDTPPFQSLESTLDEAKLLGDIVKIVPMANHFSDNLSILKLYESSKPDRLIAFCMGEKGQISRVLCPLFGSPFTYASLPDSPTAPAQITIKELRELYGLFKLED